MDFSKDLPFEVLEEIFNSLSIKDLVNCSKVSVKWREAANSGKLWRSICEGLSWNDPLSLSGIKSSFLKRDDRFHLPKLSKRLTPMSDWKLYYCQQKYISYNWDQGRYSTHVLGKNIIGLSQFSFSPTETRFPFFPIVERVLDHYEFSVLRFDSEPKKVCRLEGDMVNEISIVCAVENTIAYIIGNKLKTYNYQNDEFSLICEYNLYSLDELSEQNSHQDKLIRFLNYFICLNSNYVIAGCKCFNFHVWDRKTGDKLDFVQCPVPRSKMSAFHLQGDSLYFAINKVNSRCLVLEYNISSKKIYNFTYMKVPIGQILSNEQYLLLVTGLDYDSGLEVFIYNRICNLKVNHFTLSEHSYLDPRLLLVNDLLFCLNNNSVQVKFIPSCELKTEIEVSSHVFSLYHVRQTQIILIMRDKIEIWDWEKCINLYTLVLGINMSICYHDSVRLLLSSRFEKKTMLVRFW